MRSLAEDCLAERDVHAAVDAKLSSGMLSSEETFSFCIALPDGFKKINDNLTAVHFLNVALEYVDENDEDNLKLLPQRLIAAGQPDAALDVLVAFAAKDAEFNSAESRSLVGSYAKAIGRASCRKRVWK